MSRYRPTRKQHLEFVALDALRLAERALVAAYGEPVGTALESKLGMEALALVRAAIKEMTE